MKPQLPAVPCACAGARQFARALTQLYDSRLRRAGMEAPQFALLMTLEQLGPASQAALGRYHALDKTTVSRNLGLLESRGWIQCAVGADRRQRLFALTAEGRRRLAAARPLWKKAQTDLRSRMTATQWDTMFRVFRTVTETALALRSETPARTNTPEVTRKTKS
jgi:DNA-binding MarR family transcriptional regulator